MMDKQETAQIDDYLAGKILSRLGRTEGEVRVNKETWDLGMCETCSMPEEGFAVYVDNALVWPNDEVLRAHGGYIYADDKGEVVGGELSTYGYFFDWLAGKDLYAISMEEEKQDHEDMNQRRIAQGLEPIPFYDEDDEDSEEDEFLVDVSDKKWAQD